MKNGMLLGASLLALASFGISLSTSEPAQAATTIPSNMRGTWYLINGDEMLGLTRLKMTAKTYDISIGTFKKGKFVKVWNDKKPVKLANSLVVNKTFTTKRKGKKLILKTEMADWGVVTNTYYMKKGDLFQQWVKNDKRAGNMYRSGVFEFKKVAHPAKDYKAIYQIN